MHLDLRTLSNIAGRPIAVEVAVDRLRQIAGEVFSEAVAALDLDTLRSYPARFHAATRAVERALEAMRDPAARAQDC